MKAMKLLKLLKLLATLIILLSIGALISAVAMSFSAEAALPSAPSAPSAPSSPSAPSAPSAPSPQLLPPPLPTQLPTGPTTLSGQATVSQAGALMSINQSSPTASLSWSSFNVGGAATVNIVQPSSSSVLLNQILNSNPTQIFGHLNANGQVFLTNPSGIYFAPNASVNVGGLVATTNTISTSDFAAGLTKFTGDGFASQVINEGALSASLGGYVALLAPTVINNGVIVAQMGTVTLAAGSQYTLVFSGNSLSAVTVAPAAIAALVSNGNAVYAPGGLIILSAQGARSLQSGVIGNTGLLNATGATSEGGVVRLFASQTINAGGTIKADAAPLSSANAGTVSIIADLSNPSSQTNVSGSLSAQGGNLGGSGGAVETSASTVKVSPTSLVNTSAARGLTGTWTLDPTNFIIDSVANGGDMTSAAVVSGLTASNVVISSSSGAGGTAGNILVNQPINWNAASSLTLNALNNITVAQPITLNYVGSALNLNAGNQIDINASLQMITAQATINLKAVNNVNINSPIAVSGLGGVLSVAANNINAPALISTLGAGAMINLNATNDITIGGGLSTNGVAANININAGLDALINSPIHSTAAGSLTNVSATRDVIINSGAPIGTVGASSGINLWAGRNLSVNSPISATGATTPVVLNSGLNGTTPGLSSGTVTLNAAVTGASTLSILFNPDNYTNTLADIAAYPPGSQAKAIVYLSGTSKVYDGTMTAAPLEFIGNPGLGGNVSLVTGMQSFLSANANAAAPVPLSFSGYSLAGANASRFALLAGSGTNNTTSITPLPLIITALTASKPYDGSSAALVTLAYTALPGEVLTLTDTSSTFNNANAGVGKVVTVAGIAGGGLQAGNYLINPTLSTTGTITQIPLSITAGNTTKTYGQSPVFPPVISTGLVNNETITSVVFSSLGSPLAANVGVYTVTPSAPLGSGAFLASNYNIQYKNGSLTVTPAGLLISTPDEWKFVGTAMTPTAFSVQGLAAGDTIGAVTQTSTGTPSAAPIGDYPIHGDPLVGGTLKLSNYTVTLVNGTLHVISKPQ